MRVLVTGATGFVGRAVIDRLLADRHGVIAASRRAGSGPDGRGVTWQAVGPVHGTTDWRPLLSQVDAAIHLVARTHRPSEAEHAQEAYRTVNEAGTRRLAEQACAAGLTRLVFVSSVKAQGERADRPLREDAPPMPADVYGTTKLAAERALAEVLADGATDYTIVRPPLVYGPGVKANLRSLARAVLAGWPMPFGRVDNRRSLIGVDNLADVLVRALDHPAASNQTYLAADGVDLSTPELIRRIARAGGRRARLLPVPPAWLEAGLRWSGRTGLADRLLTSLSVDTTRVRCELGWAPPVDIDDGLKAMVASIHSEGR